MKNYVFYPSYNTIFFHFNFFCNVAKKNGSFNVRLKIFIKFVSISVCQKNFICQILEIHNLKQKSAKNIKNETF